MKHNGNFQARRPIDDEPSTRHITVIIRHFEPAGGQGSGPLSVHPPEPKRLVVQAIENAIDAIRDRRAPQRHPASAFAGVIAAAAALPEPPRPEQVNVCTRIFLYEDGNLSIRGECMEQWYLLALFRNALDAVNNHNDPRRPIFVPSRDVEIEPN